MNFNKHLDLTDKHAFLSASQYHWLGYDKNKLEQTFYNMQKKKHGTIMHDLASRMIKLRVRPENLKKAFNMFVTDAIGFNMESECVLYYSDYCFGTADAIAYDTDLKTLRIHDLKTGTVNTKFTQLDIYAALFCLEYNMNPLKITIVERIYQGSEIRECIPDPKDIQIIMKQIIDFSKILEKIDC